ncbi:hypothetical protein K402DRAFT_383563 [Aulographum hederae CBS 113979]|uniref:mRNA N(6)-methyladenine demethylase n=1 Tax=Aulographum hederae CBS 113979 TaxID=1176131 RepID=A0A6G1GQ48_9PEZI|nr:hypothetical protein K402DRAFT_383563 [Aulographum hederae CBS 113979]
MDPTATNASHPSYCKPPISFSDENVWQGQGQGHHHHTHALPPQQICNIYKHYQKLPDRLVDADLEVVDFRRGLTARQAAKVKAVETISAELIGGAVDVLKEEREARDCVVYEHEDFDGLRLLPSLLPPECQFLLLDHLLHTHLANPLHKTNLHQDYHIPFPPPGSSFFTYPQNSASPNHTFQPLSSSQASNPNLKPLNTAQALQKKLRWLTIGDQYDWGTRVYPTESPTPFPAEIGKLVTTLFKDEFRPESGVVLLYSPKDYMPVHRDVSEECERGLASFSLGCDGLFQQEEDENQEREQEMVVIRVRSGDVVQMGGKTRWAWHAMPKVMAGTCPEELREWPVGVGTPREYEKWRGYMKGKRLNISCRQVWG